LAEADVDIPDIKNYVLDGNGVHMILNFWTNQTMTYALATGDSKPLMSTLDDLPVMPAETQYVNFLRNLDELNLERLTEPEQKAVYQEFGYNKHMQVYARGIRRRLAPMLRGHADRIRMAFSLLFAMPGTPMIVYGDELGFGDNLALSERNSVRTPMQWANVRNGGFSSAETSEIIERTITSPRYHYSDINVESQQTDPDSLLNFIRRLIKLRLDHPIIGVESFSPLPAPEHVVAFAYQNGEGKLQTYHNLTGQPAQVKLGGLRALAGYKEIWQDHDYGSGKPGTLELAPYGWRWFYHG
jgi:maltose alpha-D-glucosyltransferase/alpha-amylase